MRNKEQSEDGFFADWSEFETGDCYYSFADHSYYVDMSSSTESIDQSKVPVCEDGFKAVKVGVPRNFTAALSDSVWGAPSRDEWSTLVDTRAIVKVSSEFARAEIDAGADVVYLFPIYEEKMKEGQIVLKVRLVGDGRTQHHATDTYSATPSREELLVLFHIIAKLDWDYYLAD